MLEKIWHLIKLTINSRSKEIKIICRYYYQIQGWMINRLGLKGIQLSLYAIIYGFSQDGENEYTGSLQYLCDFCGKVSKPTIINALKTLVDAGYIFRREEVIKTCHFPQNGRFFLYSSSFDKIPVYRAVTMIAPVGADDHIGPLDTVLFAGRCGHRPLQVRYINSSINRNLNL